MNYLLNQPLMVSEKTTQAINIEKTSQNIFSSSEPWLSPINMNNRKNKNATPKPTSGLMTFITMPRTYYSPFFYARH